MKVIGNTTDTARQLHIELEETIEAPIERVFTAMIDEFSDWFPHRFITGSSVRSEVRLGGPTWEDWGDGQGILQSLLTAYRKPDLAAMVAFGGLFGNWWGQWTYRFQTADGGTLVKLSIYLMGDLTDDLADMYLNGWPGLFAAVREHLSIGA